MAWRLGNTVALLQPRTASTALWLAIDSMGGHLVGQDHHDIPATLDPAWRTFCVVRNPYDLLVSAYHQKKNPDAAMPFTQWLALTLTGGGQRFGGQPLVHNGSIFWRHLPRAHVVIRYERLATDLSLVLPGHPPLTRPNPSRGRAQVATYYQDEFSRHLVRDHLAGDLDRFGYTLANA